MPKAQATRTANAMARRSRTCQQCGAGFVMRNPSGAARRGEVSEGKFCSRKCAAASKRLYPSRKFAKRAARERARLRKATRTG
jgi:hypothetical protein